MSWDFAQILFHITTCRITLRDILSVYRSRSNAIAKSCVRIIKNAINSHKRSTFSTSPDKDLPNFNLRIPRSKRLPQLKHLWRQSAHYLVSQNNPATRDLTLSIPRSLWGSQHLSLLCASYRNPCNRYAIHSNDTTLHPNSLRPVVAAKRAAPKSLSQTWLLVPVNVLVRGFAPVCEDANNIYNRCNHYAQAVAEPSILTSIWHPP